MMLLERETLVRCFEQVGHRIGSDLNCSFDNPLEVSDADGGYSCLDPNSDVRYTL